MPLRRCRFVVFFWWGRHVSTADMAGDVIEATLVSAAIECEAGRTIAADGHTHETACLNCGANLTGAFCHACGQAAHVHRTLAAFFHDLLHGVFHFEGRIWHTLPLLAWRPGQLTRRYINGQRARFISPLALFLFCVFLMFAVIQQTGKHVPVTVQGPDGKALQGLSAIQTRLAQLDTERKAEVAKHEDTDDTDAQIAALKRGETLFKAGRTPKGALAPASTGLSFLDSMIDNVRENPELVLYKVQMHAYKYSWLLIPISVPFVWLLFPFNRRFPLYDHTVFVTYSLCFMTLLSVIVIVLDAVGLSSAGALLALAPPFHMYRHLRGTYDIGRWSGIWRTLALLLFAAMALTIFAGVIVAQSAE